MKISMLLAMTSMLFGIAGSASAELLGPGPYRGEYEIDRWGRRLFASYYVSQEAAVVLKPYQGKSIVANVTKLDQRSGWGPVTILSVDSVELITNAPKLELTISVPTSTGTNGPVPVVLAFTNSSDAAVYLWPGWDQTDLFLAGGPTNQTLATGTHLKSFRFRTDVMVANGVGIEAARESPGGPERVRVLPNGYFRIQVDTKAPLPVGQYQAWWRIYHTGGPVSGYPVRSPRVDFDVKAIETDGTTKTSTVPVKAARSASPPVR